MAIVNNVCNDVAITTLPNAAIDPATGLPYPTIAVATNGGVSVIDPQGDGSGTVVGVTATYAYPTSHKLSFINSTRLLSNTASGRAAVLDTSLFGSTLAAATVKSYAETEVPTAWNVAAVVDDRVVAGEELVVATTLGFGKLKENTTTPSQGMVAYTTSSYCSGYMPGDIKGAWLASTTAESLVGTGWSYDFTTDTTGDWSLGALGGVISYDAGNDYLVVTCTTSGNAYVYKALTTVVGKTYTVYVEHINGTGATGWYARAGTTANSDVTGFNLYNSGDLGSATSHVFSFTATTTTSYINLFGEGIITAVHNYPFVSADLADPDRSVNGNGLQVNGAITKSPVATGAELMAYSGFSASNYLEQPYNSALDFGTGDFYVMGWFKEAANTSTEPLLMRSYYSGSYSGSMIWVQITASGLLEFKVSDDGAATSDAVTSSSAFDTSTWVFCTGIRSGSTIYLYANGVLLGSTTITAATGSLSNTSASTLLGLEGSKSLPLTNGSLALWRVGAGAPTADDIEFIYNQEKPLFQAGAKCTLAGSSDAITSMDWNEMKQQLYVGTSGGKSVFKGLRRVAEDTSTAITTIASEGHYEVIN